MQSIAGGGGHTVLLTSQKCIKHHCSVHFTHSCIDGGIVYICGCNGNGQLGIGHFDNIDVPIPVSGLVQQQIVKVVCGWNHTMALSSMYNFMH